VNLSDSAFARRLRSVVDLGNEDLAYLNSILCKPTAFTARRDIIREGTAPDAIYVLIEGLACRYKLLKNGKRQLVGFVVPGDLCDIHMLVLDRMDHSVGALSPCLAVRLARSVLTEMLDRPRLAHGLWWSMATEQAILRERLLSMGQRSASERLAHLFCEMFLRLETVGLTEGTSYQLPLTQLELGEASGLSAVHVNRTLKGLRAKGLVDFSDGKVTLMDPVNLRTYAGFRENYLHLRKP
jgi:CRP-like cAMP-binding protein